MNINKMLNIVKQHYEIAHIGDVTALSFRFYKYKYQTLTSDYLWALQAKDEQIEIYDNQGICINVISCSKAVK